MGKASQNSKNLLSLCQILRMSKLLQLFNLCRKSEQINEIAENEIQRITVLWYLCGITDVIFFHHNAQMSPKRRGRVKRRNRRFGSINHVKFTDFVNISLSIFSFKATKSRWKRDQSSKTDTQTVCWCRTKIEGNRAVNG